MPKERITGAVSKYSLPPMDEDQFHMLFDILHDGCFEGNWSGTARALGISVNTAKRWSTHAPRRAWEIQILQQCIKEVRGMMTNSKHKRIRKRAEKVGGQLERAGLHRLKEYMEHNEANNSGAVRHMLITVNTAPNQKISTRDLRKPGYSGGYSMRHLRQAAQILTLDRDTKGFGEDKHTIYSMPTDALP